MSKPVNLVVLPKVIAFAIQSLFAEGCLGDKPTELTEEILLRSNSKESIIQAQIEEKGDDYYDTDNPHFNWNALIEDYADELSDCFLYCKEFNNVVNKFKDLGYTSLEIISEAEESDILDFDETEECAICDWTENIFENEKILGNLATSLEDEDYVFCLFRK